MKTPRYGARAFYVVTLDIRINMAASMASQAAVRGLRAATSKHILLDKLKVLLDFNVTTNRRSVLPDPFIGANVRCCGGGELFLQLHG